MYKNKKIFLETPSFEEKIFEGNSQIPAPPNGVLPLEHLYKRYQF